jgi:hypothetical protein
VDVADDQTAVEPLLEEMALVPPTLIEALGVEPVEAVHPVTEIGFRRLEHEVEMVRHQAVAEAFPPVPSDDVPEQGHESRTIDRVDEDRALPVAARGDVIRPPGNLEARSAGHPGDRRRRHAASPRARRFCHALDLLS